MKYVLFSLSCNEIRQKTRKLYKFSVLFCTITVDKRKSYVLYFITRRPIELKIALIGEDTESKAKIREYFAQNNDYEFVFDEADGYKALQYFDENDVDVVITPIMLPELNAFDLMEHFRNKKSMKFLILSELKSEAFMMRCLTSGAAGYLLKPVNCAVLAEKLQNLQSAKTTFTTTGKPSNLGKTLDEKISNIFITVGIPAHIKGYQYLRDGIKLVVENSQKINSITKCLYPEIAKRFGTTSSKVERAIRHAIEVAWNRGKIENINNLFGTKIYTANEKPTNGEFIALIADKMRRDIC